MEWIVAGVVVLVGVVAAVGLYLGERDPLTRRYKPGIGGLFTLGRVAARPARDHERDDGAPPQTPANKKP